MSCASLAALLGALFILTWIPTHPMLFFVFVLANAVSQSIVCSYFTSSVVATSSYFGPCAMQAFMSGQAVVAVIISLIQVIIVVLSLDGASPYRREEEGRTTEDNSASLFFFLTSIGMLVALLAHSYLVRMPVYRNVAAPFEKGKVIETEEEEGLMTSAVGSLREIEPVLPVNPREVCNTFHWRHKLTYCHIGR
jgi:equilibrative nucleoside transporter 1/2/3